MMWWSWSAGLFRVPVSYGNVTYSLEHLGFPIGLAFAL
jgi:hypothetical protein